MARAYWALRNSGVVEAIKVLLPRNLVGDFFWSVWKYHDDFGRLPNLFSPKSFNEHLLRIKLSSDGRSAIRALVSDKELLKEFVRQRLGDGMTPKTIAVLHSVEEVLAYRFPLTCVVKATHTSGCVLIRNNGSPPVDVQEVSSWFDIDYFEVAREPNYRHIKPKVIVEEFLSENGEIVPEDYKIFCFRGVPAFILVVGGRFSEHTENYFSPNWRELNFHGTYPRNRKPIPRPRKLDEMLHAAGRISAEFSFVRVDFYQVDGFVKLGELTNFPMAGSKVFLPERAAQDAGRLFVEPTLDVETLFGVFPEMVESANDPAESSGSVRAGI